MPYLIQTLNNFCRDLQGEQIYIEGFIFDQDLRLSSDERQQISASYGLAESADLKRVNLSSFIVMTRVAGSLVQACQFKMEEKRFIGNSAGVEKELFRIKRNLTCGVDICIEKLGESGAAAAHTGMIATEGLSNEIFSGVNSSPTPNWFMFEGADSRLVRTKSENSYSGLLLQILNNTGCQV